MSVVHRWTGALALLAATIMACSDGGSVGHGPREGATVAQPETKPAQSVNSGGYRFVRPPVVYLDQDPQEPADVTYSVLVRLNRPLPRHDVDIGAALTVGGAGPGGEILRYGRRSRACYTALINFPAPEIPKPHVGLVVNVRLKIDGVRRPLLVRTRLRDYNADRAPSHRCGPGGFDVQE